ncbi:isopeptide-forming domain-containing fimbrial protein [Bifidobacterium castoris]|uniref:Fimbrial isopeptide formation D2 domain-containing protein n=1 Tax=Bifidobacterium castoris TaxID=2306972 RepID=A0A430FAB2_9BIFI|nr:isopeptide-forming domain-containing fimbrial protein [Bifidobacterium castoris]RSX49777.1 fimbrial isopeptide formation D2 domain-containing protein [Bifidobacterium castoris]
MNMTRTDHGVIAAALAMAFTAITAITAVPAALAEDTRITDDDLLRAQPLTVTAASDITDRRLSAIRLAQYTYATTDGDHLTGYDLRTTQPLAGAIGSALDKTGMTGYDKDDPMQWVVSNLLDARSSPWAGRLRDFIDTLRAEHAIQDMPGTALRPDPADAKRQSAQVTPGIYLVLDRTASGRASIAGMTGTGIDGKTTLKTDKGTYTLGDVEYKVHDITVGKRITAVEDEARGDVNTDGLSADTEQGRTLTMRLTTSVPNHTGYDKYYLALTDTYSKGLTFDMRTADMTVSVDGKPLDAQYWHVDDIRDGAFTIRFGTADGDIIPDKDRFPIDAPITVTYKTRLDQDAIAGAADTNTVSVEYSHNPNTWTDHETRQGDTVSVHTGATAISKTDMNSQPLAGAEFQLLDQGTPRAVVRTGDGAYRMAMPGEENTTMTLLTDKDGHLSVNGTDGTYTLKETKSPYSNPFLPQADLTVAVDDKTGTITVSETGGDRDAMIGITGGDTVQVMNARNLMEMPKTGATWLTIWTIGCVTAAVGGLLLIHRGRKARD